jgi:predicted nucleic acid-binding protein
MYLLGRYGGAAAQDELWDYLEDGLITIHVNSEAEQKRMRALMQKYHDTPMDLADASLVAAAEALTATRIFTIDTDFSVYRINNKQTFEIVP